MCIYRHSVPVSLTLFCLGLFLQWKDTVPEKLSALKVSEKIFLCHAQDVLTLRHIKMQVTAAAVNTATALQTLKHQETHCQDQSSWWNTLQRRNKIYTCSPAFVCVFCWFTSIPSMNQTYNKFMYHFSASGTRQELKPELKTTVIYEWMVWVIWNSTLDFSDWMVGAFVQNENDCR